MKIACVGGGPAGLYLAILLKRQDPEHHITVFERNRPDDTFGFGVVFSDATMDNLAASDPASHQAIQDQFWHWDAIDTHYRGEVLQSRGHGFAGMSRQRLLIILQNRCEALGVELRFEHGVDDVTPLMAEYDLVVGADGINSGIRKQFESEFQPTVSHRPNRFTWLGTSVPYEAFTFYFKEADAGLFRIHAYRYEPGSSTFIAECTDETFLRTGLSVDDEDATVAYLEKVFAEELDGHALKKNRSIWRRFPVVRNARWHHKNLVLVGDAAHSVHFSIGSGTKVAMEDAIDLAASLAELKSDSGPTSLSEALAAYQRQRQPVVASLQRAALASLTWFEETERYLDLEPWQFNFSMLTRSLRVTHENLRVRDPKLVGEINRQFAQHHGKGEPNVQMASPAPPPMFTPFRLRGMELCNRVVMSPMCQYSATDGVVSDWHLVHLGSRAVGGAGLIVTEMTDVSAEGRISPGCAGLYTDEQANAWKRITDFVHRNSPAKIGVQLAHAGRKGATKVMWEGIDEPLESGGWPLLSASPLPYLPHSQVPSEMTRLDMDQVRDDFVAAAKRAIAAEFDLLELHFAHGYLLASFLSPLTNQRSDEYGGDIHARLRFPLEVFDAVRHVWPERLPMSVRISATDWKDGGNTATEAIAIARALKAHGCDLIDVSAGQTVRDASPKYGRLFQTPFSDAIRHDVKIPTLTVGNISSHADVNSILAAGRADLCALARAHLYDPYWTHHAAVSQGLPAAWPPQYGSLARYTPRFE